LSPGVKTVHTLASLQAAVVRFEKGVRQLKFKFYNTMQQTYTKYYVDVRESLQQVSLGHFKDIAIKEVNRLSQASQFLQPAYYLSVKLI